MKKIVVLLHTVFLIAFVSASYAQQSLADLAKQEKERREEIKNNRVITDEEAAKYKREPQASPALPEQPSGTAHSEKQGSEAVNKPQTDNPEADEPTDFEGRPESFWRKTMAEARQKVKDLTNEANVIVLKIADLQNKFYSMDDGFNARRPSAGNSKVVLRAGPQQAKPGKGKAGAPRPGERSSKERRASRLACTLARISHGVL